jgi:hypothetical protein
MNRILLLRTAAALMLSFPLGAGAVPDADREIPDAWSLTQEDVHGVALAIQIASDRAQGLRHDGGSQPGTAPNDPAAVGGFDHPVPFPDRDEGGTAPIPEPSSFLLFTVSLLMTGAALRTLALRIPRIRGGTVSQSN